MFDQLTHSLINRIAREGMTESNTAQLVDLLDTLAEVSDYGCLNIVNTQALLLLIADFTIPPTAKRLVDEVKGRMIRQVLGPHWRHGVLITDYELTTMNRSVHEQVEQIRVYEDGSVKVNTTYSVQPPVNPDELILNDLGNIALLN